MRVVVVSLLLLLALPEVALSARWEKDTIPVWDFTPDEWRPDIQRAIDDFNANMPLEVPRLNYIPMGEQGCDALPWSGDHGQIDVCLSDGPLTNPSAAAETRSQTHGNRLVGGLIGINPVVPNPQRQHTICHELMHAVTDVDDDSFSPHIDASCVQGWLPHLGTWDIAYAEAVYAPGSSGHRHRRATHRLRRH